MTAQDINTAADHPTPLLDRLPETLRASLTPEQQQAFSAFAEPAAGNAHPVDLRVTVPVPGRPMFERARHPLRTFGNIVFLGSSLVGVYVLGMVAFLAAGSVLQF